MHLKFPLGTSFLETTSLVFGQGKRSSIISQMAVADITPTRKKIHEHEKHVLLKSEYIVLRLKFVVIVHDDTQLEYFQNKDS